MNGQAIRADPIGAACEQALHSFGYDYEALRGGEEYRFTIKTADRDYPARFVVDAEQQVLQYEVDTLAAFLPTQRAWFVELLTRVNQALVIGSVAFDWDTGQSVLRFGVDLRHSPHTAEVVESILNLADFPLKLWSDAFASLSKSRKISPKAALEAAMVRKEVAETPELSAAGRRAMLRLL